MRYKKSLSTVVTSLIMILIVLVAIGIIWIVIRNLIGSGTGKIDINAKCLEVGLKVNSLKCYNVTSGTTESNCVVEVERVGSLEEALSGLNVVFTNNADAQNSTNVPGEWNSPTSMKVYFSTAGSYVVLPFSVPMKSVTVVPYFKNEAGEKHFCMGAKASLTK